MDLAVNRDDDTGLAVFMAENPYLNGEYGIKGYYIGVPAVIGNKGIEKIVELTLNDDEKKLLDTSFQAVKTLVDQIRL